MYFPKWPLVSGSISESISTDSSCLTFTAEINIYSLLRNIVLVFKASFHNHDSYTGVNFYAPHKVSYIQAQMHIISGIPFFEWQLHCAIILARLSIVTELDTVYDIALLRAESFLF